MNNLENRQVHESELYDCLRSGKINFVTAYERDIDPLCYFVFVRTESERLKAESIIDGRRLSSCFGAGRIIKAVNLGEIISGKWLNDIFTHSVGHNDFMMLALFWVLTHGKTDCFIGMNIMRKFGDNLTEDELFTILFTYIRKHGYRFRFSGVKYNKRRVARYSLSLPYLIFLVCERVKNRIKVRKKYNEVESNDEAIKRFIAFLDQKFNLLGNYRLPNSLGFVIANIDGEKVFIKGIESSERVCSLENEINAQKKLLSLSDESKKLFVCMKSFCYEDMKYIVYPFVEGCNVGEYYEQGNRFDSEELHEFGKFLLNVLDVLNEKGIVHRDLRPANIMFTPSDRFKFRVIDFGCAYSGGMNRISFDDELDRLNKCWVCECFRYFDGIADDAASAYLAYIYCGGDMNDEYALRMKSLVGRIYVS